MQADAADQHQLLDLATTDTRISQIKHRRTSLPELQRIKELAAQRHLLSEELVAAEARLSDVEVEQQQLESDLNPARERLARDQQRISDGSINDPKALKGINDEIAHLEARISKLEDDQLEVMQALEEVTAERDAIAARRREVDTTGRAVVAQRDKALAELDSELRVVTANRAEQAKAIPADLLGLYDKVAAKYGSGAVELVDGRCTGCRLEINLADLRRYKQAPANQVLRCEECGRILVRTTKSGL